MIHKNMRMRDALKIAQDLGCLVRHLPASDEILVDHRLFPRPVRVKCTRHDTTQQLMTWLRRLDTGKLSNPHRRGAPNGIPE